MFASGCGVLLTGGAAAVTVTSFWTTMSSSTSRPELCTCVVMTKSLARTTGEGYIGTEVGVGAAAGAGIEVENVVGIGATYSFEIRRREEDEES